MKNDIKSHQCLYQGNNNYFNVIKQQITAFYVNFHVNSN